MCERVCEGRRRSESERVWGNACASKCGIEGVRVRVCERGSALVLADEEERQCLGGCAGVPL